MSKPNLKEVQDFILDECEKHDIDPDRILYDGDEFANEFDFEIVDEYGGEGMGESYWYVFKIKHPDHDEPVFIRFDGRYDSWNGSEFSDEFRIVEPKQKTITVYE